MAVKKITSKSKGKSKSKKVMTKPAAKKMANVKEPMSKSSMIAAIMDVTSLSKKEVVSVMDAIGQAIEKHVKGPGTFVLPGLMKVKVVKKPARPARKGVNPFTGEEIMIKARPASRAIKIKPLKKLKEMVA